MKFNGPEEALKILQSMPESERAGILKVISQRDPDLAAFIEKNLVQFNDLLYLTTDMIRVLLREVEIEELGLALRGSDKALVDHFINNVSENNKAGILYIYEGPPQSLTKVNEAREKIMAETRKLIEKGQIVIDQSGSETLV